MVQRVATTTGGDELTAEERAEAVILAAADHLRLAPTELPQRALRCQLDDLRQRLEQRLTSGAALPDGSATTAELLISILRLQCEFLDHDLCRRMRFLTQIRNVMGQLRGLSPRETICAAPMVLSRELGFGRAMISIVRGSVWLPHHIHIEDEGADPLSPPLREYIARARIHLADAPLEAELIRKRCGALVPSPREDAGTFKEIIDVSGCSGYVAAPITVGGRAIGMLHADRPKPDAVVTMDHLDQLEAFAECLATVFESAVLEEKAAQQRAEVDNLWADVDELLRRSTRSSLWSMSAATPEQRHAARPHFRSDQPAVSSLTAREREIMAYVATGATNSQIARCLVITEGTVKSHLKHIARKLKTSSRAEAVAAYVGIAQVSRDERPRGGGQAQ
jgi:DNA-binding CsgD family transcriptional regulator